jgi:hypothetical protein
MSESTCDNISRCTFGRRSSPTCLKNPTLALWWLGRACNFLTTSQSYPALPVTGVSWTTSNLTVEYRHCRNNCSWSQKNLPCLGRLPPLQIFPVKHRDVNADAHVDTLLQVSQPFRRRGTLDLALHISRYPLRNTPKFLIDLLSNY